jgi:lipoyl(octanoyl) transferase
VTGALLTRWLPVPADYAATVAAMQAFTAARTTTTPDELWLLEHPPVFTLGIAGRRAHVLDAGAIPVVATDRGGQVTYHGPGQLVAYPLIDVRRRGLTSRALVLALEDAVIRTVAAWGIAARGRRDAPGVYVGAAKLASIGLRIRRGGSYHGLALNVDLDLAPFGRIDPCGHPGQAVTVLRRLGVATTVRATGDALAELLPASLAAQAAAASAAEPG